MGGERVERLCAKAELCKQNSPREREKTLARARTHRQATRQRNSLCGVQDRKSWPAHCEKRAGRRQKNECVGGAAGRERHARRLPARACRPPARAEFSNPDLSPSSQSSRLPTVLCELNYTEKNIGTLFQHQSQPSGFAWGGRAAVPAARVSARAGTHTHVLPATSSQCKNVATIIRPCSRARVYHCFFLCAYTMIAKPALNVDVQDASRCGHRADSTRPCHPTSLPAHASVCPTQPTTGHGAVPTTPSS